jgi:hypothetical protein
MSNATPALATFEILIGNGPARERTTLRTTRDGLFNHLRASMPDASIVKRGYTTSQIRSNGRIVGSVQELG